MAKEILKNAGIAENTENKVEVAVQERVQKKETKSSGEPAYPIDDLASSAAQVFGVRQECVTTALKAAGKTEYTVTEARGIVQKFLKREVK